LNKVLKAAGYPPARVWHDLYLSDIISLMVVPAKAGIQKNRLIRLFTKPSMYI